MRGAFEERSNAIETNIVVQNMNTVSRQQTLSLVEMVNLRGPQGGRTSETRSPFTIYGGFHVFGSLLKMLGDCAEYELGVHDGFCGGVVVLGGVDEIDVTCNIK